MRELGKDEEILLNGFHEYQLIDGELWETTDEYIEVLPGEEIRVKKHQ